MENAFKDDPAGTGPARTAPRSGPRPVTLACGFTGIALALGAMVAGPSFVTDRNPQDQAVQAAPAPTAREDVAEMSVDDKAQLLAEGLDAQTRNAAIPVSGEPLEQAGSFWLKAHPASYDTALKCLTQAIYYEAAVEPIEGRRAVAQVVLNRMRHPAYPKSVCGVVYQGAERRTGCQFSFTCDGSLLRQPMAGPWRQAREIAKAALAGHVEKSVGTATHYHADYVLPKWAFNLAKIEQLGRHIFYRFQGGWGRSSALSGRYSGVEAIPQLNMDALKARLMAEGDEAFAQRTVPGLSVTPHVTDRHAATDVGGRIDTKKEWRLAIPDPVEASTRYRAIVDEPQAVLASSADRSPELASATRPSTVNP